MSAIIETLIENEIAAVCRQITELDARREQLEIAIRVVRELDEPSFRATAEAPEAAASEHPEAHSMATGGKQDAGAVASGHENADCSSAGGRAETDASPAAPNTETTGPLPSAGEAEASPASKPNGRPRDPNSLLARIRDYVADHPDATAPEVADALDARTQSVRNAVRRSGLELKAARRGRKPSTEQRKPDPAPAPAPKAKPAPAVKSEPARPGSVIMHRAPVRPTGRQFWLRDEGGKYLNRFCLGFTSDRREAWTGDQDQLAACRRVFPLAIDLREQPVEKDQPMPAARQYA